MDKISLADGPITDEQKELIRKRLEKKEQSPTAHEQSESYQFFKEEISQLGKPYDVTRIPISVLEQMQRDPMIAFAVHFLKTPIQRANWHIECEDARVASFIDNALREIMPNYLSLRAEAWFYGFKPVVKRFQLKNPDWKYLDPSKSEAPVEVWSDNTIQAVTWKNFVGLPSNPSVVEPSFNQAGNFDGIIYHDSDHDTLPFPFSELTTGKDSKKIDLQHALWHTNEKATVNGSLWGFPRTGYAYRPWWSYWFRWALFDRFFERKADPPYVVRYPTNEKGDYTQAPGGEEVSLRDIALSIGESARGGGAIAMPGDVFTGFDDRPTSVRKWDISELEVKGDMTHFLESFEYLDKLKLRCLWLQDQAVMNGSGSSSNRNTAGDEIKLFKEASAATADEFDDEINKFVIPDLIAANFPEFEGTCIKKTTGFTEADVKTMQDAMRLILTADQGAIQNIDVPELIDRLGLPSVSQEEILRREEKIKEEMKKSIPPVIEPESGKSAGVDEQGLYVQPREVLTLQDTIEIPSTVHYKDTSIKANTKQFRKIWKTVYQKSYEDFIQHLKNQKLTLSEDLNLDEADDKADEIVANWQSEFNFDEELEQSIEILSKIIRRAGKIESDKANLDSNWKPENDDVADYIEERGLEMVNSVNSTVADELKTFLSNQIREGKSEDEIADQVRENFSDFPDWKADRITKSEIRNAYNFSTLLAGKSQGVKLVQAHDAEIPEKSDPECLARDKQFFKINDALQESTKEHPNGTLSWSLIPDQTELSVIRTDEMPEGVEENTLATFDDETDTIYISNELPEDKVREYLGIIGKTLSE